eukprot:CAMPEP_0171113908 /NCGR_PEP_ID=MMETSP0766_2-20121228/83959_1 /TAXON_ID=439317 /ORGANISM="Gambierdiscus australes, Strain CAWD 149" /LENGTH=54 /DNA_ID=CAMNT_0011576161 /DNA_START=14 /DNA_END=174 /DNA_ORIENTATION=+
MRGGELSIPPPVAERSRNIVLWNATLLGWLWKVLDEAVGGVPVMASATAACQAS